MAAPSSLDQLKIIVESVLFVSDEPVELSELARIAECDINEVTLAVEQLAADCQARGVRLQLTDNAVQLVTAPETASYVERFLGVNEHHHLSHAALETLAIIAYKQPITRTTIEAIRGVNCDRALASLKSRGLITEIGRAQSSGRPYLYGTTFRFLEYFGLEKPQDLPSLKVQGTGNMEQDNTEGGSVP